MRVTVRGRGWPLRVTVRGRGWPLRVAVRWHLRAGLQRGWQARPPGIVPVLDKGGSGYGAALTSLPTAAPRIDWIRGAVGSWGLLVQAWWYMSVPMVRPVVCTWTMGTFAAAAGIAVPTRADPATPSARIVGMIKARPMRMSPPPQLPGLAGCCGASGWRDLAGDATFLMEVFHLINDCKRSLRTLL